MTFEEEYRLSFYKKIAEISEHKNVVLVQHTETKKIYVKKEQTIYTKAIYDYLMQCTNPHIPKIYECIESDNRLIIIEQYVQGNSLQEIFNKNGPIEREKAIQYMITICDVLLELHNLEHPVIHRDLKPDNIIIENNGNLMIIDFNSAKHFNDINENDTVIIGTRKYAAPEQYGFHQSDTRTDIYAVGVMLNYMVSGKYPPDIFQDIQKKHTLTDIIKKCTEFAPNHRYQSAAELRHALCNSSVQVSEKTHQKIKLSLWNNTILPPGFRTGNLWKMLLAILGYTSIFSLCLEMEVSTVNNTPATGFILWLNRISVLIWILSTVFFECNYMDIQKHIPFMQKTFGKWIGYFLIPIITFCIIVIFISFFI